jgi:origin recognition complex subunit 1
VRCSDVVDVQLWRHLTGEFVGAKLAERNLINYFESDPNSRTRKSAAPRKLTVCLVDEIDFLTTRDENIVYNFFNWPLNKNSGLLLIGVSNVMDLPERLSTRCELAAE